MRKKAQGNKKTKFLPADIILLTAFFFSFFYSSLFIAGSRHPGLRFLFSHREHREYPKSPSANKQSLSQLETLAPVRTGAGAENYAVRRMRVTAYCPCEKCCGGFADGVTASGHRIKPGDRLCAADKATPFGATIVVPGYNNDMPVCVLDRGGAITGDRLDVLFDTHAEAKEWASKY